MRLCRLIPAVFLAVALAACGAPEPGSAPEETAAPPAESAAAVEPESAGPSLAAIADGDHRSAENRARNASRHPVETLEFFGLQPDMTVVEIWPSGGWYTEVIAPYVNEKGTYVAAHWDPEDEREFVRNGVKGFTDKLAERPDLYGNVQMGVLMPPEKWDFAPEGSVDMIVTFRNIHNWMPRGYAEDMFAQFYKVLKPGGVLGVVEHRGNPDVEQDPKAASGYVNEAYAIQLAEAAGFELAGKAEINANPADTKDYDTGVWTLPPTLRKKDEDREKYLAIGESDRFTLKFVKPAA
ncbi:MAG: class I SAM-dependent methyltransferase [Chromatiales bacterium]|nr:MAG: class I SAM-dependent methyltransferase [Chromatiales bacterium]